MGIGIVLLAWAVAGSVLASVAALILGWLTARLTRSGPSGRKRVILAAILFPFACMGWMFGVFGFQAVINGVFLHRDVGLGDAWECPLPNGYAVLMIDTPDEGFVYNPATQSGEGVGEQDDAVGGVRLLQVSGPYVFGGTDTQSFDRVNTASNGRVDSYFVLDTRTGKHVVVPSYDALQRAALAAGIALRLEDIGAVYRRYRFTWFDMLAGILFIGPPLLAFVFLARWIIRVRRTREIGS